METIPLELRKLGLNEKEVKVYLASLELGPTSVQNIARLAKITRPTAYEIIKRLEGKSLFTGTKGKGKRFFSAHSPERILGILRTQKKEIEEKEREFIRIIASLEARYSKEGVKIFKGKEGMKSLEEIISFSSLPELLIVNPKTIPINSRIAIKLIKKRLGRVKVIEINSRIKGALIIFDKVAYFPSKKQIGFLIG